MSVISRNVAKFSAILALVALPSMGIATVVTHTPSHGTAVQTTADGPDVTPTPDPTASKDTTGWQ